ncbi:hypothetical protein DFQ26_005917 [Actinomortierella ambigua]|nr:hypothetical protein DFQ26_005917 [Actinomortierella ambigua]
MVSAGKLNFPIKGYESNIQPGGFIVEYEPGVSRTNAHNNLRQKVDFDVRAEYKIFNGAAITVKSFHDGHDIARIPGVKNVWPIIKYKLPKTFKPSIPKGASKPLLTSSHNMTGVSYLHEKYKYTGKGVKVGIIDSGIDYTHPALGGCFGEGCRVRYGWDFVGDDYTGGNTPTADADPMDCAGHGTHVAGVVGANAMNIGAPYPFVGVAPDVTFGSYRIFGCYGSASTEIIMSAMERAYHDGMDIINLSLGRGSAYLAGVPEAILGDKLVEAGVHVIAAGGNDGDSGIWTVLDTGLGNLSSSVAAVDNIAGFYYTFKYAGATHPYFPSWLWPSKPFDFPASATLVPIFEKDGKLSEACAPADYNGIDVKGKVVLVLGGLTRCSTNLRGDIAMAAGASAILVQTIPVGLTFADGPPGVPMASIEFQAGEDLIAAWRKNPAGTITWSKDKTLLNIRGGGIPSSFSSFGFDGDLRLKPDLAAPGGNILSTYPLAFGDGYTVLSGTSMSTPYVAGSHALWISAKKTKPRGDVLRNIFKSTATALHYPNSGVPASVAKQGAGLINVVRALQVTTTISPDKIELLDSKHFVKTVTIKITNHGKRAETYHLYNVAAQSLNSYSKNKIYPNHTPVIGTDHARVKFSTRKVTIKGGKTASVKVYFAVPKTGDAAEWPLYSGYVVANPVTKGSISVSIPYGGIKGDVSKIPIMDTTVGLPTMVRYVNWTLEAIPNGYKFDFSKEKAVVLTRMGSHSPDRSIRIFDSANKFVGYLYSGSTSRKAFGPTGRDINLDYEGQLALTTWEWDGRVLTDRTSTAPVQLPSGTYSVVVASQYKLTKGTYPSDYEVFNLGSLSF